MYIVYIKPINHILANLIIGIVIGFYLNIPFLILCALLLFINWVGFLFKKNFIFYFSFIIIGIVSYENYNKLPENHFKNVLNSKSDFEALIIDKGKTTEKGTTSYIGEINKVIYDSTSIETTGKIILYIKDSTQLKPNESVLFKGQIDSIRQSNNPYTFDYKKFLKNKKIYHSAYLKDYKIIKAEHWNVLAIINNFKNAIINKIINKYGENNEVGILKAMILGDKNTLSKKLKKEYSKTGTMHLLAISGLHTGIIYSIVYLLCFFIELLPRGKVFRIITSLVILWIYASITGFSSSVCRASLMISLLQITLLIKRDVNTIHILSLSAVLILIINPNNLFDVGFQLSYSAVGSILLFFPLLKNMIPMNNIILRYYYNSFLITLIATLGTLPLSIFYFNSFPTSFLITNLIIAPLFVIVMILGLLLIISLILNIDIYIINLLYFESIQCMNQIIKWSYNLHFHIENICISKLECSLIFGIIITAYLSMLRKKYSYLYIMSIFIVSLQLTNYFNRLYRNNYSELIVFDNYNNLTLGVKYYDTIKIFSQFEISQNSKDYILEPYITYNFIKKIEYYNLSKIIMTPFIKTKNILKFKNYTFYINTKKTLKNDNEFHIVSDLKLIRKLNKKNVITNRYYVSDSIYQTPKKGAFRLQIPF